MNSREKLAELLVMRLKTLEIIRTHAIPFFVKVLATKQPVRVRKEKLLYSGLPIREGLLAYKPLHQANLGLFPHSDDLNDLPLFSGLGEKNPKPWLKKKELDALVTWLELRI